MNLVQRIRHAIDHGWFGGSDSNSSRLASEAADEIWRLREALEQINDNSTEDNEWDAVDKLHENQRLAEAALRLKP